MFDEETTGRYTTFWPGRVIRPRVRAMNETTPMTTTTPGLPDHVDEDLGDELFSLTVGDLAGATEQNDAADGAVLEKLNEYRVLVAPVERAIRELHLARGMLRARAEDEINALSPALGALAEALGISTLDLLTSSDRSRFLHEAVLRSELPVDEIRRRIASAAPELSQVPGVRVDNARDATTL